MIEAFPLILAVAELDGFELAVILVFRDRPLASYSILIVVVPVTGVFVKLAFASPIKRAVSGSADA